ncbi:hypothetical protein D3C76_1052510 [compost metagenome]
MNKRRIDVGHAVAKTRISARHAVMDFVRVQHKCVARHAVAQRTLVVKTLHASEGAADRVGIVAMWVVAMAAEPRFDALHAARLSATYDPIRGGWPTCFSFHDQTFPLVRHLEGYTASNLRNYTAASVQLSFERSFRVEISSVEQCLIITCCSVSPLLVSLFKDEWLPLSAWPNSRWNGKADFP